MGRSPKKSRPATAGDLQQQEPTESDVSESIAFRFPFNAWRREDQDAIEADPRLGEWGLERFESNRQGVFVGEGFGGKDRKRLIKAITSSRTHKNVTSPIDPSCSFVVLRDSSPSEQSLRRSLLALEPKPKKLTLSYESDDLKQKLKRVGGGFIRDPTFYKEGREDKKGWMVYEIEEVGEEEEGVYEWLKPPVRVADYLVHEDGFPITCHLLDSFPEDCMLSRSEAVHALEIHGALLVEESGADYIIVPKGLSSPPSFYLPDQRPNNRSQKILSIEWLYQCLIDNKLVSTDSYDLRPSLRPLHPPKKTEVATSFDSPKNFNKGPSSEPPSPRPRALSSILSLRKGRLTAIGLASSSGRSSSVSNTVSVASLTHPLFLGSSSDSSLREKLLDAVGLGRIPSQPASFVTKMASPASRFLTRNVPSPPQVLPPDLAQRPSLAPPPSNTSRSSLILVAAPFCLRPPPSLRRQRSLHPPLKLHPSPPSHAIPESAPVASGSGTTHSLTPFASRSTPSILQTLEAPAPPPQRPPDSASLAISSLDVPSPLPSPALPAAPPVSSTKALSPVGLEGFLEEIGSFLSEGSSLKSGPKAVDEEEKEEGYGHLDPGAVDDFLNDKMGPFSLEKDEQRSKAVVEQERKGTDGGLDPGGIDDLPGSYGFPTAATDEPSWEETEKPGTNGFDLVGDLKSDPPNAQPISSGSAPSKNTTVELAKRKSDEDKQDSPSKKFRSDLTDVASNAFASDPGSSVAQRRPDETVSKPASLLVIPMPSSAVPAPTASSSSVQLHSLVSIGSARPPPLDDQLLSPAQASPTSVVLATSTTPAQSITYVQQPKCSPRIRPTVPPSSPDLMKMLDADNDDEEIDETISSSAGEVQPASVEGEVGSVTGGVGDAPARDEEAGANGQKVEKDGSSERWDETLIGEECLDKFFRSVSKPSEQDASARLKASLTSPSAADIKPAPSVDSSQREKQLTQVVETDDVGSDMDLDHSDAGSDMDIDGDSDAELVKPNAELSTSQAIPLPPSGPPPPIPPPPPTSRSIPFDWPTSSRPSPSSSVSTAPRAPRSFCATPLPSSSARPVSPALAALALREAAGRVVAFVHAGSTLQEIITLGIYTEQFVRDVFKDQNWPSHSL